MNVIAHQEKKNEKTKMGKRKAGKDRRLIAKMLCADLLQPFRGQHGKKMKGSAWGNWDP